MRSFGYLFLIVFCSPLYFLIRGRWIAAIINGCIYIAAIPLLIVFVGVFLWLIAVSHGMWDFMNLNREDAMKRQATLIAEAQRARSN